MLHLRQGGGGLLLLVPLSPIGRLVELNVGVVGEMVGGALPHGVGAHDDSPDKISAGSTRGAGGI